MLQAGLLCTNALNRHTVKTDKLCRKEKSQRILQKVRVKNSWI